MRITPCKLCRGMRLKQEALAVTVCDKNIHEITSMSIGDLQGFLQQMQLTRQQELIGKQILKEIKARVGFLVSVGLEYLSCRTSIDMAKPSEPLFCYHITEK